MHKMAPTKVSFKRQRAFIKQWWVSKVLIGYPPDRFLILIGLNSFLIQGHEVKDQTNPAYRNSCLAQAQNILLHHDLRYSSLTKL